MLRIVFLLLIDYCIIFNAVAVVSKANKQACTDKCTFDVEVDKIGNWPDDKCQTQSYKDVCRVTIQFMPDSQLPATVTFDPVDNGTDPSTQMPKGVTEILYDISAYSFWLAEEKPIFEVNFRCSTGKDGCDKAFITKNWATIRNSFQRNSTYKELYPLIYNTPSTVSQCYTSANTAQNCSGYCKYDLDTTEYYGCVSAVGPTAPTKVIYERQRVQSGPNQSDYDKLSFLCNVNKCNGPKTLKRLRKIFGIPDSTSNVIANSSFTFIILLFLTLLRFQEY
jgi:hypothetical protein